MIVFYFYRHNRDNDWVYIGQCDW